MSLKEPGSPSTQGTEGTPRDISNIVLSDDELAMVQRMRATGSADPQTPPEGSSEAPEDTETQAAPSTPPARELPLVHTERTQTPTSRNIDRRLVLGGGGAVLGLAVLGYMFTTGRGETPQRQTTTPEAIPTRDLESGALLADADLGPGPKDEAEVYALIEAKQLPYVIADKKGDLRVYYDTGEALDQIQVNEGEYPGPIAALGAIAEQIKHWQMVGQSPQENAYYSKVLGSKEGLGASFNGVAANLASDQLYKKALFVDTPGSTLFMELMKGNAKLNSANDQGFSSSVVMSDIAIESYDPKTNEHTVKAHLVIENTGAMDNVTNFDSAMIFKMTTDTEGHWLITTARKDLSAATN